MTEDRINKLVEAFAIGASDKEACAYAEISHQALYNYQEKHPEFVERKEALKHRPTLLARQSVVKGLVTDANLAMKYLERRLPNEFATRRELTGADGKDLPAPLLNVVATEVTENTPEQG